MDMVDLTQLILLLDCGEPVSGDRRGSEMDLCSDVWLLPARIAVAGCMS
jgi:hypothetical protein